MKRSFWLWLVPAVVVSACAPTTISGDDGGDADVSTSRPDATANDVARTDVSPVDSAADAVSMNPDSSAADSATTPDAAADSSSAPDSAATDSSIESDSSTLDSSTPDAAPDATSSGDSAAVDDAAADSAAIDDAAPDSADAAADASAEDSATDAGAEAGSDAGAMPGYTVSRMAGGASCDSPASWTDTGLVGDDSTMDAPAALPFSLSYYGGAVTHWSATSNGFAELWTSASGIPSDVYRNEMLPTTSVNGSMVAPFWDDLDIVSGASVRTATVGAAPARRFVIEWNDVSTVDGEETLRFQVKLFETSNVVEFHYCSLTTVGSGTRQNGDEATVGMQNLTQTIATNVSHNAVNAVETGLLLRFTPR
ncbi:MAG: hypothetical protein U0269_22940 [Polyangiales bacterium]